MSGLVAISTALITLVGAVLPQLNESVGIEWVAGVGLSVIGLATAILIVGIGAGYLREYAAEQSKNKNAEVLVSSIPTLVRFRSRTDELVVDEHGNGTLKWSFDVEKSSLQRWNTLEFPIFAESALDLDKTGSMSPDLFPARLQKVLVDGRDVMSTAALTYEERRLSASAERIMEFGKLSVPVRLDEGRSRAKLDIELAFDEVWSPFSDHKVDFFLVDIPYVTDTLRVLVSHLHSDLQVAPPVGATGGLHDRPVVAASAIMGSYDALETEAQSDNLSASETSITWETKSPKLGYRYRLNFRVIRAGSGGEPFVLPSSEELADTTKSV